MWQRCDGTAACSAAALPAGTDARSAAEGRSLCRAAATAAAASLPHAAAAAGATPAALAAIPAAAAAAAVICLLFDASQAGVFVERWGLVLP